MYRFIKLYGEEEYTETSPITITKSKEKFFDLEKYPTMVMKSKKNRYKIVLD